MENSGTETDIIEEEHPWDSSDNIPDFRAGPTAQDKHQPRAEPGIVLDRLIVSLVLALTLYLVMWFLNDAWYFLATRWAQASGRAATATAIASPTSSSAPTVSPTPSVTLPPLGRTSGPSSISPPALFCGGMAAGAAIVLAFALAVLLARRRPEAAVRGKR